ncbi:PspC domain-containing protein [Arthrobacter sp. NPDC092385]|uniref:PspC domain-containing protein n=1 Tax=Arthrobacter sp. NPDC092385 TaxID=3363943 RepID=UPI00381D7876
MTSAPTPGGPSWQHEPAAPHQAGGPASSSFFRWVRGLDITRAPDRWVGGVAGGVAHRTGLDLALVRGLIVVLAVFGGIGVLLYGLAWALLPEPDGRIHVEQAGRGSWTSGLTGAAALVAIGLWRPNLPLLGDGGGGAGLLWALFWIGAVVLFVYWIVNRSAGQARPGGPAGGPEGFGGPGGGSTPPFGPAPSVPATPPAPPVPGGPGSTGPVDGPVGGLDGHAGPTDGHDDGNDDGHDAPASGRGADQTSGPAAGPAASTAASTATGSTASAASGPAAGTATGTDGYDDDDGDDDGRGAGLLHESTHRTVPLPYQAAPLTEPYPLPYRPGQDTWSGYPSAYSEPSLTGPAFPGRAASATKARAERPARPSGSVTALLIGGAVVVAAVLLVLDYAAVLDLANPAVVALASAAIVLALGIVALGARGRTSGLVGFTAALATLGALGASFTVVGGAWIVAQDTRTTPASLGAASGGYSVLAAQTTIDLTDLPAPARDVVVPVNSLASDVTVIVPADVPVEVRTRMALGDADARGAATGADGPPPVFQSDDGLLQVSNGDLNPEATGAALILDVRGALSDVSIITEADTDGSFTPRTSTSTPTGDIP